MPRLSSPPEPDRRCLSPPFLWISWIPPLLRFPRPPRPSFPYVDFLQSRGILISFRVCAFFSPRLLRLPRGLTFYVPFPFCPGSWFITRDTLIIGALFRNPFPIRLLSTSGTPIEEPNGPLLFQSRPILANVFGPRCIPAFFPLKPLFFVATELLPPSPLDRFVLAGFLWSYRFRLTPFFCAPLRAFLSTRLRLLFARPHIPPSASRLPYASPFKYSPPPARISLFFPHPVRWRVDRPVALLD